jgi:hypothetical protein
MTTTNNTQVQLGFTIRNGNGPNYQSNPTSFVYTMQGTMGPTPGTITVPIAGIDINLSQIVIPGGLCWITNYDNVNAVEYGIRDTVTDKFYPLGQILPGEPYLIRLSPAIGQEEPGTGSGTLSGSTALHFRPRERTASVVVRVDAFDA